MATPKKKTKRVRSDIRVSPDLADAINTVAGHLGMTKQSLMIAATTSFCLEVLPLTQTKKKATILAALKKEFLREMDAAEAA